MVSLDWTVPADRIGEVLVLYAAADDDGSGGAPMEGGSIAPECDEDNNLSQPAITECAQIE